MPFHTNALLCLHFANQNEGIGPITRKTELQALWLPHNPTWSWICLQDSINNIDLMNYGVYRLATTIIYEVVKVYRMEPNCNY
jgi:hypothetical protein